MTKELEGNVSKKLDEIVNEISRYGIELVKLPMFEIVDMVSDVELLNKIESVYKPEYKKLYDYTKEKIVRRLKDSIVPFDDEKGD